MSLSVTLILAVVAFVTSIISAILGMGGGVMLLAVMLCFLSHGEAIPTHAAVQIASNGTRVLAFVKHVDGGAFGRFLVGLAPGAVLGWVLLASLGEATDSEPYLKSVIGLYILFAGNWVPSRAGDATPGRWWHFPLIGFASGTAALTVGAVGPLIAPVFARRGYAKERLIATKAVCQLATHVLKIPAFILLRNLDVSKLGMLALVMIVVVIPGTLIGKRLLKGVAERHFRIAYRVALTGAGLKVLIFDGLVKMPIW